MKLTIFAAGSRGDIQPCIALGKGLQAAGYALRLAAPADFADLVGQHGLDFFPLSGDVQQIMASDTGREFMETGALPAACRHKPGRKVRRCAPPVRSSPRRRRLRPNSIR